MPFDTASQPLKISELTLADVLAAVQTAALPNRQRQELSSALRTVGRALDRPLERILADPSHLSPRLTAVAPIAISVSARSWTNVRFRVRKALGLIRRMSPGRNTNPLTPAWAALWGPLESRRVRIALSRFVRWCSANGIAPEAVAATTFVEFREHLDDALLKHPNGAFAELVRGWRVAQGTVESWPKVEVTMPDRRDRWTLPWSVFPPSLRVDCEAWLNRLAGRDLLEEAPFRPVQPSTVKRREQQIRGFASALVLRGRDPATITNLKDLVEIEAYKSGLRFFLERSGGKSTTAIVDLAGTLRAIARHHLKFAKDHLDRMATRRLSSGRRGLTQKNRDLLRQFDDLENVHALLGLPEKLIGIAGRKRDPRAGALLAQFAVAIEILIMAPIRLGNLCALDLEQNLVRPRRRGKELHIVLPAEQVKNKEPLEYPLSPPSVELIEHYLKEHRLVLASPNCTALFPGRRDGAKKPVTLGLQITETIRSHTGLTMNPHLFRHVMAKIYLDANPGGYEVVRRVLGHRSIDTTTAYYTGLETAAAVRHFDEAVLKARKPKSGR
jgi:integrase